MDLRLRLVATHPRACGGDAIGGTGRTAEFALSTRKPGLVLGQDALLVEQSTATMAVRCSIRTAASIDRLVYCGGCGAYLAFLEDNSIAVYSELLEGGVGLSDARTVPGDDRSVSMAMGSQKGSFAVFTKSDSPSLYYVELKETSDNEARIVEVGKLRGDIQGAQDNVGALGQGFAKLRGTFATNAKSRPCQLVAIAAHPSRNMAGAAYLNGIIRVWDIGRKELWSQFDAQLLLREEIVNIAFHPDINVLCACTSQGRLMSFQIRGIALTKAEEPQLSICKLRDRTRRYRAMCFLHGSPTYLLLLTSTRKIAVRSVNQRGQIVPSRRFPKASRPIPTVLDGVGPRFTSGAELDPSHALTLACEPTFGLIAISLDSHGVLVYQRNSERVSAVRRPVVGDAIQTGFSNVVGKAFTGPVTAFSEVMFAHEGKVYSITIDGTELIHLCNLPRNSEVRRIEVARDQFGSLFAALVFLYSEIDSEADAMLSESEESPNQYVLITKRGNGEAWNVSESTEGTSGCFLHAPCRHDRILVLSPDGTMVSVRSFVGQRLSREERRTGQASSRPSRGVQRFSVGHGRVSQVFRAPFSSWCAVVYEDASNHILTVSKNAFRRTEPLTGQGDGRALPDDTFELDPGSAMPLRRSERMVDIRWQRLPTGSRGEQNLAAIMTTDRLYIIRDVFELISRFDFNTLDRTVLPFAVPTMSWLGPAVILMFGQYVYAITLDGKSDFIAGMSQGENACALAAVLPDRIIYARPSGKREHPTSVVCRPVGFVSVLVRGMLALPSARNNDGSYYMEKLRDIMLSHDASQGSEALIDALILNDLAPVAYILIRSESGQYSLPPLKRATCFGRIGDFRGALNVAEKEYVRLPSADAFHSGSELFRLLQRILNMSMAAGDFAVGRRCSELLGRRGTFTSFVDCEGGNAALVAVCRYANESGNRGVAQALSTLLERSSKSCIAMDSSFMLSPQQLRDARAGIEAFNHSLIALGTEDSAEIYITISPQEDANGAFGESRREQIEKLRPSKFSDRLEMTATENVIQLRGLLDAEDDFGSVDLDEGLISEGTQSVSQVVPVADGGRFNGGQNAVANAGGDAENIAQGLGSLVIDDGTGYVGSRPLPGIPDGRFPIPGIPHGPGPMIAAGFPGAMSAGHLGLGAAPGMSHDLIGGDENFRQDIFVEATERARMNTAAAQMALAERNITEESKRFASRTRQESAVVLKGLSGRMPEQRAQARVESAFAKLNEGRYASAMRDIEQGLTYIANGHEEDGIPAVPGQIVFLVNYLVALQIWVVLDKLAQNPRATTIQGRLAAVQLATAMSELDLRRDHRVVVLVRAVNEHLAIENYGTAAQMMAVIRNIGCPPALREDLRAKYALCTARGFVNSSPRPNTRLCWRTLRAITPGIPELKCTLCPALFSAPGLADEGVDTDGRCPCCQIGVLAPGLS